MATIRKLKLVTISAFLLGSMFFSAQSGWGCDIPVFRYALERWPADPYHVFVFHRGELSEEHNAAVGMIQDSTAANCEVYSIDLDDSPSEGFLELWETQSAAELPWGLVRFPMVARIEEDLWSGPFENLDVQNLLNSPAREEIAKRLLDGQTAVWLFLESGNEEKDAEAKKTLETQLKRMMEMLRIPEPALRYNPPSASSDPSKGMRVEFSIVTVSREDAEEKLFVEMLMKSEPDLTEYLSEPMAFPMYGRGRALFALVGKGINETNIFDSCAFLVGPCACEFKMMNPGTDLLMPVDWDTHVMEQYVSEWERSMIMGQAQPPQESQPAEQNVASEETVSEETVQETSEETASPPSHFTRNLFIIIGVIVIINIIVGVRIVRRRSNIG